jgi:hypothetical protein
MLGVIQAILEAVQDNLWSSSPQKWTEVTELEPGRLNFQTGHVAEPTRLRSATRYSLTIRSPCSDSQGIVFYFYSSYTLVFSSSHFHFTPDSFGLWLIDLFSRDQDTRYPHIGYTLSIKGLFRHSSSGKRQRSSFFLSWSAFLATNNISNTAKMVLKGGEVAEHNSAKSCWVIVHVWTPWIELRLTDIYWLECDRVKHMMWQNFCQVWYTQQVNIG